MGIYISSQRYYNYSQVKCIRGIDLNIGTIDLNIGTLDLNIGTIALNIGKLELNIGTLVFM